MNLRPDKVKGVVLIDKVDYHNPMSQLSSDKTQFKIIKNDLTLTRLKTVQNYLKNLCKRNNISEGEKNQMIPISAQLSHVHDLQLSQVFANILKLCSIIDTTNTSYCKIVQYLLCIIVKTTHHCK